MSLDSCHSHKNPQKKRKERKKHEHVNNCKTSHDGSGPAAKLRYQLGEGPKSLRGPNESGFKVNNLFVVNWLIAN